MDLYAERERLAAMNADQLHQELSLRINSSFDGKPTYYVAYEFVDGSYRPVAAADASGRVNISFDQTVSASPWTDADNLSWLERRVGEITRLGRVR
jgi:hypothetical protein